MFGGVASLKGDTPSAGAEFRMAAAGPLVTVIVVVVCYLGGIALVGQQGVLGGDHARPQLARVLGRAPALGGS